MLTYAYILDASERDSGNSTLKKLSAMTDEDYDKLELYPDFDE